MTLHTATTHHHHPPQNFNVSNISAVTNPILTKLRFGDQQQQHHHYHHHKKTKQKEAQLGVPQSEIQVELD